MRYRALGQSGIKVSEIGFGAWALGESWWGQQSDADSLKALHRAADLGVTLIDTAAVYGDGKSERLIAQFLRERTDLKGKVAVATKTPPNPAAKHWRPLPHDKAEGAFDEAYLRANVEERLRNLGTDCLDILQLHSWGRAWNRNPSPLLALQKLKKEGKIRAVGISTPEHDQNSVIDPMKQGLVDVIQVIYNIFEQEPAAELLPLAQEKGIGIIVRVAFDEGSLTGKFTKDTTWPEGDFRSEYFKGPRLERTVNRVEAIRSDLEGSGYSMPQAALLFALAHPGVSTVIPGIRNIAQADANCGVSDLVPMPEGLQRRLHEHAWHRGVWYPGNW
jgi:aryl-alcohol dehydrogenase-like predicted oxidoreductase